MLYSTYKDFTKAFPDSDSCRTYLSKVKWGNGFVCRKCQHSKGCLRSGYRYQCYKCSYIESCTVHTVFHGVRFDLYKAFSIIYLLAYSDEKVTSVSLAKQFSITQSAAWRFANRVKERYATVHLDQLIFFDNSSK